MQRRGISMLFLALPLLLAFGACDRAGPLGLGSSMHLALAVDPSPPRVGPSALGVALTDPRGAPVEGAMVKRGEIPQACMQPLRARLAAGPAGRCVAPFT